MPHKLLSFKLIILVVTFIAAFGARMSVHAACIADSIKLADNIERFRPNVQDVNADYRLLDDCSILLHANTWSATKETYTITSDTVLNFGFQSREEGEFHSIGFSNATDPSEFFESSYFFKLYGTQSINQFGIEPEGIRYNAGYKQYSIPVGQYLTGDNFKLVFVADNDKRSIGDSVFDRVTLKEAGNPASENLATVWQPSNNRGLVAIAANTESFQVYLSWRLFVTDDSNVAFNIYRSTGNTQAVRINKTPIRNTTDFVDKSPPKDLANTRWYVTSVLGGVESDLSLFAQLPSDPKQPYLTIDTPSSATHGRKFATGDFDGDGRLDYSLVTPSVTVDPFHSLWRPSNDSSYRVLVTSQDGESIFEYPMGPEIELGIWYAPYIVHDLDRDGIAELIVKAGAPDPDTGALKDDTGRVRFGPEYLRIVNNKGKIVTQADWPDRTGFRGADAADTPSSRRKYEDYNRQSRNQIGIAHIDGETPHIIVARGTYGKMKVAAYKYINKKLTQVWYWENEDPYALPGGRSNPRYQELHRWWGQGAHSMRVADLDNDGKEEIILGAVALDHDGSPMWSLDSHNKQHTGDLDNGVSQL